MKRSRINDIMRAADDLIRHHGFVLPPFANWSPDQFKARTDASAIVEARCGWDITDYGQGKYDEMGLFLF
ncbi:MAG: D-lyxose/D-mannose family sugar isomerase, partial [Acetobacteraceae bacterium]